jgi:integrase
MSGRSGASINHELPPLARTMVELALMSGLRRGELFALRWRDFDEERQYLTVREAVYDGTFSTPKTAGGVRQIPLSEAAVQLTVEWRARAKHTEPESLTFATWSGKPISPNNVVRRWIVPACETLGLTRVIWLTLRRTYSSWAHENGVSGKVIAQLMGHAKVDTTLNVYTQVTWHDLRHTFASWLIMKGASLRSVAELLGHRGLRMVMRYASLAGLPFSRSAFVGSTSPGTAAQAANREEGKKTATCREARAAASETRQISERNWLTSLDNFRNLFCPAFRNLGRGLF